MQPNCHTTSVNFTAARRFDPTRAGSGAILLLLFAGCSPPQTDEAPAKPFAGVALRLGVPADPAVRAMIGRHAKVWSQRSGGSVEVVAPEAIADIRVCRPADLGRTRDRLGPLPLTALKNQDNYEFSRFLRHEVAHHMNWAGQPLALPLMGESLVLVYRADLLGEPRHAAQLEARFQARFRHGPRPGGPATWQEVEVIAAYFAEQKVWAAGEETATPRPSLPPLPASDDEFDRDFHALAGSFVRRSFNEERGATLGDKLKTDLIFSYQLDAETGKPAIDGPGFLAAFKMMGRLQAFRPNRAEQRPMDSFRAGKAIVALATLADLPSLNAPESPVRDRFAIARIPGSDVAHDAAAGKVAAVAEPQGNFIPYHGHGGWIGGIDKAATHSDAALDLLAFLTSPPVSLEVVCEPNWGGGPTRSPHIDNRSGWHNYQLNAASSSQLIAALDGYYRSNVLNPVYRLRVAKQEQFLQAFARIARSALLEGKDAKASLSEVARAWTALEPDAAALVREYRQSVGLR